LHRRIARQSACWIKSVIVSPKINQTPKEKPGEDTTQRRNELFTLFGFGLGCASWGWTAIAPESSIWFGTLLLFAAVVSVLWGVWRVWAFRTVWFALLALVSFIGFASFDWRVVVKRQRNKPFRDLLVEGYHITNECQGIPGDTQMPEWMRDQSKGWQSRAQQLIGDRLKEADAQCGKKLSS
jgi:hypothetical protein